MILIIASIFTNFLCLNRLPLLRKMHCNFKGSFLFNCSVKNKGKNNSLVIEEGCRLFNCTFCFYGNNNHISISKDCMLKDVEIIASSAAQVDIGNNTYITGKTHLACIEGKRITIGRKCLFSNDIVFRTGDSHSITNDKNERINSAEDIIIGDHVWLSQKIIVLKGANIGKDSVVGTGSVVTGKIFKDNSIIAGNPARIIKSDINWDSQLI